MNEWLYKRMAINDKLTSSHLKDFMLATDSFCKKIDEVNHN